MIRASFALGIVALGFALGCAEEHRAPAASNELDVAGLTARQTRPGSGDECEAGAQRACNVTLEQQGGLITCYRGVQYCQEGGWGDCIEGELTHEVQPDSVQEPGLSRLMSLSSAVPAACSQACDPACMRFVESSPPLTGGSGSGDSGSSCTHDTCTVDASPLAASCGSCVATVCAADSSCCSTDWDSVCVDLAYSKCLNRLPPLGLCDFGIFATQTVTTANRPSAGAAIGAGGDVTIGTDATPSRIVTKGNLTIQSPNGKNVTTTGGVWVGGSVTAQNGGGAKYTGDWNVGGGINLNGGNTIIGTVHARQSIQNLAITGDAYAGASFSGVTGSGARISSSTHAAPVIDLPTAIPTRSVSCTSTTDKTIERTTVTLPPGNYRDVTLQNGSVSQPSILVLSPGGSYTFRNLTINSGCQYCKIQLGTTSSQTGPWDVSVCQRALLEGPYSYIAGYTGAVLNDPSKLILYVNGNDPGAYQYAAKIGNDFKFVGVLMVPNGSFRSEDRGSVKGAVWARAVSAGTDLGATQISRSDCEALNLAGTMPVSGTCPISTTVMPPITVDEYVYEAKCPDSTAPRWKNLTWTASVPTGSSAAFSAKVGTSVADLASRTYTALGTAAPGTPSTTTCSLSGPSPLCPVALTDQLELGYNQGSFLSLRIEANAAGGAVSVSDWKVSYTCQYDE